MKETIRVALKIATGLAAAWVLCMFVFCLFSERTLHRAELQLQDAAAQLAEEKDAHEEDKAMVKELRKMRLELKNELRVLKKQLALKKGLSEGTEISEEEPSDALSERERSEARHELLHENRTLLRRIAESRYALRSYRTPPCLETLDDEYQERLRSIHGKWRAAVQSLLNVATRGEADKVLRLQEQVRELADSADVLTGNTQLYFNQAGRIAEVADELLNAATARQLLLRRSEELDIPVNPEISPNP